MGFCPKLDGSCRFSHHPILIFPWGVASFWAHSVFQFQEIWLLALLLQQISKNWVCYVIWMWANMGVGANMYVYIYITRYNPLIINRTWLTPPQPRSGPWRVLHQVRLEILPQQRTDVWTTNSGWSTPQGAASGEHRKRQSQKKKRKKSQQNSRNLKASTSFKSWRLSCNLPFQGPSLARQL